MSGSLKIFAITRDRDTLDRVLAAIKTKGFAIAGSCNPADVRKAIKSKVDVLVMDILLERPRAVEIARAVRKSLPDLTIIALTPRVVALPEGSPFSAVIKFPVAPPVLHDRVRRAVRDTHTDTRALEAEIELAQMRAAGADHYGVLGVSKGASQDEITRAYDAISLLLHPDKVRHLASEQAKSTALELFVRAGEAYSTLKDPGARRRYDIALERGVPVDESRFKQTKIASLDDITDVPKAKKALRKAQRAIAQRHYDIALMQLDFALQLDPDNRLIEEELQKVQAKLV